MDNEALDQAFANARLKVNRAHRHINEAQTWFARYCESDFGNVIDDTDAQTGQQIIRVVANPTPSNLSLAIGDAFHCLSASLDYVMSGLMRAKTGNATRIGFPTNESRQALRKSFMAPKERPCGGPAKDPPTRRIVKAFPRIVFDLLTTIKPYRGGDFALWEIRKADNLDKHNLIIPTITITSITIEHLVDEMHNVSLRNTRAVIKDGGVAAPVGYGQPDGSRLKCEGEIQATASITFPDGAEVFAGELVFPTLLQCLQSTAKVIDRIEAIVSSKD